MLCKSCTGSTSTMEAALAVLCLVPCVNPEPPLLPGRREFQPGAPGELQTLWEPAGGRGDCSCPVLFNSPQQIALGCDKLARGAAKWR